MATIQASATSSSALPTSSGNSTVFIGNGTSTGANSTLTNHNATNTIAPFPPFTPAPTSSASSSSPISSKLGAGLGAAFGFAAVLILLVLWHIIKAQRQRRQQRRGEEEYAARIEDRTSSDGQQRQDLEGTHSSSTPFSEKGKLNEAVVTTTLLTSKYVPETHEIPANSQTEVSSARRARGQGRERRPLGGSRWERRDGHGRTDSLNAQNMAQATAGRPKFSFEGVPQSEDSLEMLSQLRTVVQSGGAERRTNQVVADHDPEKGDRARHIYEMEPY